MKVISVNIGKAEKIGGPGSAKYYPAKTGIFKKPVDGSVLIGKTGLTGDAVVNIKHHGGVDQAVYIYSREDYAFWEEKLGTHCPHGLFGENITVEGLLSGEALVGDRYSFGDLVMEVTSPRIPCATFAARMNDGKFPKAFMAARKPGVYCRVLNVGTIEKGLTGTIKPYNGESVSLSELFETYPYKKITEEQRQRYCSVPLHWKMLAFLTGASNEL